MDTGYYTSEALTLLYSLIGIPSISREEEAAADFLQNYIEETGIMTGRSGNNIWCISPMFDINRPTILLNSQQRFAEGLLQQLPYLLLHKIWTGLSLLKIYLH